MEVFEHTDDSVFNIRASLGLVRDWNSVSEPSGQEPENITTGAYKIFERMWKNDTVINLAFDKIIEVTTNNGFMFVPRDGKLNATREKEIALARKLFLDELNFDEVLDNLLYQMCIYGDAYLELRRLRQQGEVHELHPLETMEMRIDYDKHGAIQKFIQTPLNSGDSDRTIDFAPENVVHFRYKWVGSRVYSHQPLEPVAREWETRRKANQYLQGIFKNLPPKIMYTLINASKSQKYEFENNVIRAKTNPAVDLIAATGQGGGADAKMLKYDFDSGLQEILKYLRQEVLIVTGIPPVWIGILDSQRGDSEAQIMGFEMKIRKFQQKIESQINRKLMQELGFPNLLFKFPPISLKAEKSIAEVARQFRDMGMNEKGLMSYLSKHGFDFPQGTKFESPMEKNKDMMPSREKDNKQTKDKSNNLDQTGSAVETRGSTPLPDSSKYW